MWLAADGAGGFPNARAAGYLAERVLDVTGPLGPWGVVAGLYLMTALATSIIPTAALVVLSDRPLPMKEGDEILLLGAAVPEPAKNIVGYSGTMPLVIWAGTSVEVK